jgi:hypothetical protein
MAIGDLNSCLLTYTTLDGEVLDLSELTTEERAYFDRTYTTFRAGRLRWGPFANLVTGTENPLTRATGGRVTDTVWTHPLFRAVRDLEDRVGYRTGELVFECEADGDPALLEQDPIADTWLPSAQAAREKGVSLAGLHLAIKRGDLIARPAKPGGARLVVSRNSLDRWMPNEKYQAAGRARAAALAG